MHSNTIEPLVTAKWRIAALVVCLGYTLTPSAPAVADPSLIGEWAPVQNLPWRPVHSILLPTGKVMIYRNDDPRLWDPADGSLTTLPQFGYNPFCNGHVLLADGRVMFTGGQIADGDPFGLPVATYYDPFTNVMTDLPDMAAGRWYPSQVTLADGNVVTMSGDTASGRNVIPEVWEVNTGTWRSLSNASLNLPLYPASFLAPNGRVFVATTSSRYLDTSGTGNWETVASRQASGRDNYGSATMYDVGKVMYSGGGDPPLSTSEAIDLNATIPAWNYIAPMPEARRQQNTTILPDGRVLVTGGSSSAGFNNEDGPKSAIVWDPDSNAWTTWATEAEYRGYHSEAILLPDARVASIGGDSHPSLQIFSPPYLFNGPRPTLTSAPSSVQLGETFFVETPESADITHVTWISPSAVTHTKNMNQRINTLSFTPVSGGLNVTAPAYANDCPPGLYMLFILNSSGVPSVARFIQVSLDGPTPPNAPTGLTASAGDAQVDLTWNAAIADGYKVKQSTTSGGPYTTIASEIVATSYTDFSVSNGTTYYYVVSTVNSVGESPDSSETIATPAASLDDLANGEIAVSGTITGSYFDTQENDGLYESIQERQSGGKPANRHSFLKHKWTFNVNGGNAVTFYVDAHHTVSSDADDFVFAYSPDDTNYIDMVTVTKTSDDNTYQLFNLPSTVSGTVYVQVMDTDQTSGNRSLDSLFVDNMFIRSEFGISLPFAPTGLTATAGNTQVTLAWNASAGAESYNVYRSPMSGAPYTPIALEIIAPSYTDTNVFNGTTYFYVVSAVNENGNSDVSNEASATPQVAATMSVQSISVTTVNAGKGQKRGRADVVIVDNNGAPVPDASVTGTFSGDIEELDTQATTDTNGHAIIDTVGTAKGGVSLMFCVGVNADAVTHATLTYVSAANTEGCDTN